MKRTTEKMKRHGTRYGIGSDTLARIVLTAGSARNFGKAQTVAAWVEHFWQAAAERMAYAAQLGTGWRS